MLVFGGAMVKMSLICFWTGLLANTYTLGARNWRCWVLWLKFQSPINPGYPGRTWAMTSHGVAWDNGIMQRNGNMINLRIEIEADRRHTELWNTPEVFNSSIDPTISSCPLSATALDSPRFARVVEMHCVRTLYCRVPDFSSWWFISRLASFWRIF